MADDNSVPAPSDGNTALKVSFFILKFAIAGGIIVWLLHRDFHKFLESLRNASPAWLAMAAALMLLQLSICAFRWWLLLRSQEIRISLFEAFSLYLQGCFFSLAIPGGAVGGDLVKATIIATRSPAGKKLGGALSVIADRVVGMIALFGLSVMVFPLAWPAISANLAPGMKTAFIFLLLVSILGLLGAALFPFHDFFLKIKPLKLLSDKLDSLSKGAVNRILEVARAYKAQWRTVLATIALSLFLANTIQILCLYCLVIGVSGACPDILTTSLAMLFGGTASTIPLTPGGIGTRDAVCKAGLMAGGVSAGAATAAPLIFTSLLVVFSLIGGLFFAFDSLFKRKAPTPK